MMKIENPDLINAIRDLCFNKIPYNVQRVYEAFLKSTFIIPTPTKIDIEEKRMGKGERLEVIAGKNSEGKPALFVFTDIQSLLTWKPQGICHYLMKAPVVLDFTLDNNFNSIVVNPACPTGKEFTLPEIKILKEGTIVRNYDENLKITEVSVPKGMKVHIGTPTKKPSENFIKACQEASRPFKEIESVYLYQVVYGEGEPHLNVGIYFEPRLEENAIKLIISNISNKIRPLIKSGEYVDFAELKNDNTFQVVKKFDKPIYQKKYSLGAKLKKSLLIIVWRTANKISYPYLFIGNMKPKKINNIFDKLKLSVAIKLFDLHYSMDRNKNGSLLFAGKCYQSFGEHETALEYFKKLWETDPYNQISFKEIGTECLALERYEEGLKYALKEVSQYPKNADSNVHLALLLLLLKRVDEAHNTVQHAKQMDGDSIYIDGIYKYICEVKAGKKPIPERLLPNGQLP